MLKLEIRIKKLEGPAAERSGRVAVEDLTGEQREVIARQSGYNLALLSDAELNALPDCYADTGELEFTM